MLAGIEQDRICDLRERTGWALRLIAGEVGHPHSTVHRTPQRAAAHGAHARRAKRSCATNGRAPDSSTAEPHHGGENAIATSTPRQAVSALTVPERSCPVAKRPTGPTLPEDA